MSHSGIQEYTKDFNFLWKADFDPSGLSAKGYELELIRKIDKYQTEDKNFINVFFKAYSYIPLHSSICFLQLASRLIGTKYQPLLLEAMKTNEAAIVDLFKIDLELADAILQLYESLECINCKFLIPYLSLYYKWIQDYGQEVCNKDYGL